MVEKLLSMVDWDDYMKRIKMKNDTTKFVWDGDNCVGKYTELIEQYHYDSEEEKMEHKIEMELNGWNDSGQFKEMVSGSLMPGEKILPYMFGLEVTIKQLENKMKDCFHYVEEQLDKVEKMLERIG